MMPGALQRSTRWAAAHPYTVDAAFAALVGAATVLGYVTVSPTGSQRDQDVVGLALIVLQAVAFAARRRAPMASLITVIVLTVAFWVADYPTNFEAFSLLSVYAAAAYGGEDRRRVWQVVGAAVVLLAAIAVLGVLSPGEDLPVVAVIGIAAIHLTAAVTGEVVYDRRRRLVELVQRAARAEAERELLAHTAVLDERSRIARDLHDVVAHGMSVMVVQAGAAERMVATRPDRATEALRHIQETGREALADMRRMLGVLRDEEQGAFELAPQPTMDDIGTIVQRCVDAGIPTRLTIDGCRPERALGPEMAGYRIVQEALTNVIKHAGRPARAAVTVTYAPDHLRVEVIDDGRGATTGEVERATGHGLIGMRERTELYRGTLRAGPRPGGGFRVAATIPFTAVDR